MDSSVTPGIAPLKFAYIIRAKINCIDVIATVIQRYQLVDFFTDTSSLPLGINNIAIIPMTGTKVIKDKGPNPKKENIMTPFI
ncbi:hypothetical protein SDC9_151700 [bioreactor metagenome]|uniref:Uncharacterized protein n=1 Tax=bioreactor metagenome TaxID=1076179 RepID=A0A645ETC1_9ZZZZ